MTESSGAGSRNAVWITLIIVVAALIAFALWMFRPMSDDSAEPVPTVTVTIAPEPAPQEPDVEGFACFDSDIRAAFVDEAGAAGSQSATITFENTGVEACTLAGYPLVRFFTEDVGDMGSIPIPAEGMMAPAVVLPPGSTATARLTVPNPDMIDGCTAFAPGYVAVTHPGGGTARGYSSGISICLVDQFDPLPEGAEMAISPVVLNR
ncbi:DUF4232 domain-containing protein [Microbacterium sp. RU33B]|uniref:DUF4232 domain-containing protein n=1 Tax=Microbacterium sp. RU33B TaxID=1907390 RepID=UPI0009620718|nr:DUF4232 domain-containing protein [Microbacterium sp. RU33B]SIT67923.1 Protein of unknown function [Microbacterium sp. RU33B]